MNTTSSLLLIAAGGAAGSVARYLFGYALPSGFLDVNFAAPFPEHFALEAAQPGDIYLAGPETVQALKETTLLDMPLPVWVPFGLPNRRFLSHPRRVYVIEPQEYPRRRGK